jgi:hypothetical protein
MLKMHIEILECPNCGANINKSAEKCDYCGINYNIQRDPAIDRVDIQKYENMTRQRGLGILDIAST